MEKKIVFGALFILLAIGVYYGGSTLISANCAGWNIINPLCWLGTIGDILISVVSLILAIIIGITGVLVMLLDEEQMKWVIGFGFFAVLLTLDIVIPDPLPLLDEIVLGMVTMFFGVKMISSDSKPAGGMF